MRVVKCDACGATYEPYFGDEETGNANGLLTVNFDKKGHYDKQRYVDLCPDCARKLHAFITGTHDLASVKNEEVNDILIDDTGAEYEQEVEE